MTNNQTLCHSAIIRQYFRRKKLGKQFLVLLLVTITCFSYCAGTTRHTATAHDVPGILRGIQTTTALTTSGECQSIQYSGYLAVVLQGWTINGLLLYSPLQFPPPSTRQSMQSICRVAPPKMVWYTAARTAPRTTGR